MAYASEAVLREWMDHLSGLQVQVKRCCWYLYCEDEPVGWIHDTVLTLREVGLEYLTEGIKWPTKEDKIQELVFPLDYTYPDWPPRAVQDTADLRKRGG